MMNTNHKNSESDEQTSKMGKASSEDISKIINWVVQLKDSKLRESSLLELSKMRENFSDLAIYLWYSPGIVASLYYTYL